jgi:hypothetical protein
MTLLLGFAAGTQKSEDAVARQQDQAGQATPAAPSDEAHTAVNAEKKSTRERTVADAAELAATADQIRGELKKAHLTVLPLGVVEKTRTIEKLAKQLRGDYVAR